MFLQLGTAGLDDIRDVNTELGKAYHLGLMRTKVRLNQGLLAQSSSGSGPATIALLKTLSANEAQKHNET